MTTSIPEDIEAKVDAPLLALAMHPDHTPWMPPSVRVATWMLETGHGEDKDYRLGNNPSGIGIARKKKKDGSPKQIGRVESPGVTAWFATLRDAFADWDRVLREHQEWFRRHMPHLLLTGDWTDPKEYVKLLRRLDIRWAPDDAPGPGNKNYDELLVQLIKQHDLRRLDDLVYGTHSDPADLEWWRESAEAAIEEEEDELDAKLYEYKEKRKRKMDNLNTLLPDLAKGIARGLYDGLGKLFAGPVRGARRKLVEKLVEVEKTFGTGTGEMKKGVVIDWLWALVDPFIPGDGIPFLERTLKKAFAGLVSEAIDFINETMDSVAPGKSFVSVAIDESEDLIDAIELRLFGR